MKTKKIILLFLPFVAFLGSIFCCLYTGSSIELIDRTNRINDFINSLAAGREGEAVFADMDIGGIDPSEVDNTQKKFFEKYNNKLSLSVFHTNIEVTSDYCVSNINMMECGVVDQYYNDMYLYTNNDWRSLDSNSVFISASLDYAIRKEKNVSTSVGESIIVKANNIEKEMRIAGFYLEKIDGEHNHFCLGKLIKQCYGETIFAINSTVQQFRPENVVAMFSYNAFNNGAKYLILEDFAAKNNKSIIFDFNDDFDILNNWNVASSTQLTTQSIVGLIFAILATIAVGLLTCELLLIGKDILAKESIKIRTIFEFISYFCIIILPLLVIVLFKNKYWSLFFIKTPIITKGALCFLVFLTLFLFFYFAFKNRILINKLLIHKNNSELDVCDESNKRRFLYIGSYACDRLKKYISENCINNYFYQKDEERIIYELSKEYDEIDVILKPVCLSENKSEKIIYSEGNINYYSIESRANKLDSKFFKKRIKELIFELSRKNAYENIYIYSSDLFVLSSYIKDYFPNCKLTINLPSFEIKNTFKLKRKLIEIKNKRELYFADEIICPQHVKDIISLHLGKDFISSKIEKK